MKTTLSGSRFSLLLLVPILTINPSSADADDDSKDSVFPDISPKLQEQGSIFSIFKHQTVYLKSYRSMGKRGRNITEISYYQQIFSMTHNILPL